MSLLNADGNYVIEQPGLTMVLHWPARKVKPTLAVSFGTHNTINFELIGTPDGFTVKPLDHEYTDLLMIVLASIQHNHTVIRKALTDASMAIVMAEHSEKVYKHLLKG